MKIIPKASNVVEIEVSSFYSDKTLKLKIKENDSVPPSLSITIDENAEWEINKIFEKLGNKNHIDVKLKGDEI